VEYIIYLDSMLKICNHIVKTGQLNVIKRVDFRAFLRGFTAILAISREADPPHWQTKKDRIEMDPVIIG